MTNQTEGFTTKRIMAILKQQCPRCMDGTVFKEMFDMNQNCPTCDLAFEREPGYFTGAMYLSYGFAIAALVPTVLILLLWFEASMSWLMGILTLQIIAMSPIVFRYSRVAWMHIDQVVAPR